jgi:hypothetical protein
VNVRPGGRPCRRPFVRPSLPVCLWFAIYSWSGDDDAVGDGEDYHIAANKKKKQSVEFLSSGGSAKLTLGSAVISTAPVDALSNRLQHLDHAGGSMLELTDPREGGALAKCQRSLWEIANPWAESERDGCCPALWWHLRHSLDEGIEPIGFCRAKTIGLAAAVWCRLELRFHSWPWRLLSLPLLSSEGQDDICRDFLALPQCCLDSWWSRPMRAQLNSLADMKGVEFMTTITTLSRKLKATNMSLESDLSEVRSSVPVGRGCPNAEKLAYLAHLGALMKDHVADGCSDSRGQESRSSLLEHGVPLEQRPPKLFKRMDVSWRNACVWRWRSQHPQAGDAEVTAEVSRLALQWASWILAKHNIESTNLSMLEQTWASICSSRLERAMFEQI